MRLRNSVGAALAAMLLGAGWAGAQLPPPEIAQAAGPHGTSQDVPGRDRYDEVGYGGVGPVGAPGIVLAAHRGLVAGTFVEVTALDSGKTAAVMIASGEGVPDGRLITLSPAAAKLIGVEGDAPVAVRVRLIEPSGPDQNALRNGRAASDRLDAPLMLLVALRKRLPAAPRSEGRPVTEVVANPAVKPQPLSAPKPTPIVMATPVPIAKPAPTPKPLPTPKPAAVSKAAPLKPASVKGGLYVQVAALSAEARARALAASIGGSVVPGGKLYRVRTGPYADRQAAQNARDALARRGYGGATIVSDH